MLIWELSSMQKKILCFSGRLMMLTWTTSWRPKIEPRIRCWPMSSRKGPRKSPPTPTLKVSSSNNLSRLVYNSLTQKLTIVLRELPLSLHRWPQNKKNLVTFFFVLAEKVKVRSLWSLLIPVSNTVDYQNLARVNRIWPTYVAGWSWHRADTVCLPATAVGQILLTMAKFC